MIYSQLIATYDSVVRLAPVLFLKVLRQQVHGQFTSPRSSRNQCPGVRFLWAIFSLSSRGFPFSLGVF